MDASEILRALIPDRTAREAAPTGGTGAETPDGRDERENRAKDALAQLVTEIANKVVFKKKRERHLAAVVDQAWLEVVEKQRSANPYEPESGDDAEGWLHGLIKHAAGKEVHPRSTRVWVLGEAGEKKVKKRRTIVGHDGPGASGSPTREQLRTHPDVKLVWKKFRETILDPHLRAASSGDRRAWDEYQQILDGEDPERVAGVPPGLTRDEVKAKMNPFNVRRSRLRDSLKKRIRATRAEGAIPADDEILFLGIVDGMKQKDSV